MSDMIKWRKTVQTMAGQNKEFAQLGTITRGGAYVGFGLAYIAEIPILGDFMDGCALGYVAQRQLLQEEKLEQARQSLKVQS